MNKISVPKLENVKLYSNTIQKICCYKKKTIYLLEEINNNNKIIKNINRYQ